jgi:O-antigen/teichoic acid export membrane protein
VGLAGLLTLAYARIDQLIVYELAPHRADAGLYAGIYRILDTGSFVPGAVMTTLFPLVAAAVPRDMERARRLVQSALDYLAMVSLPVLAFSLVGAKPLLRFLLGPDFVPAAGALPILMGAYVAICWGYVAGNMVIVLGLQRRFIRYAVVGLALNIALNLALVPAYGYRAAAWVTLATELTVIGLSLRAVLREMELRPRLGRLLRVVAVAATLTAVLLALRSAGAGLAVLVAATAALYPPLLVASRALDLAEVRALVAGRTMRRSRR